jgi:hypothetical protein
MIRENRQLVTNELAEFENIMAGNFPAVLNLNRL